MQDTEQRGGEGRREEERGGEGRREEGEKVGVTRSESDIPDEHGSTRGAQKTRDSLGRGETDRSQTCLW
uniref:Uncharacterized protein n=1 Tax=Knipowitschia caucasica TaxID=637954 RepID=A0AAV2KVC3_KNICA